MKRFWVSAGLEPCEGGYRITLDGRPIRTQGGRPQIVPTAALAEAMAEEWSIQGEKVAPEGFAYRDLADFAIDHVRPDRAGTIAALMRYAETDTLCYRADPDDALYRRQRELWGWDPEAERDRARKLAAFEAAAEFARLARD